jgi:putative ABC transport system permease protein
MSSPAKCPKQTHDRAGRALAVYFTTLIFHNLFQRRARSTLTILGLGVALAAVVILTGIAANFERSFLAIFQSKGIDLVVARAGISNQLSSTLDQSLFDRIRSIDGVTEVAASLMDTVSFEQANLAAVLTYGWESGSLLFQGLRILDGRALRPDDTSAVMLGRVLALNLGKKAGDRLEIVGEPFQVVGIFESPSLFENGGLIMPMRTLQHMMGREGQVTGFVVRAASPDARSIEALKQRIEAAVKGVVATPARDHVQGDVQLRLAKAMSWATAAVAIIVGSLGMLNTMTMAVFERTREIGVLRALGWRRLRVLTLVLGESLVLGAAGTLVGLVLGGVGTLALTRVPTAQGFIDPRLPSEAYVFGLLLGPFLSLLGGLYPASRAAALDPIEALRYE